MDNNHVNFIYQSSVKISNYLITIKQKRKISKIILFKFMLSERKVDHFRMNRDGIHIHDNIYSNKKRKSKISG